MFVVFVFVVGVFGKTIHGFIVSIFIGSYKVSLVLKRMECIGTSNNHYFSPFSLCKLPDGSKVEGASQHIDFSSNPEIFAYVPQIKQIGQPFPYLACDIDDIDQGTYIGKCL